MAIKDKLTAARGARRPNPSDDGDDVAVRVANLERELAEARAKLGEHEKETTTWRTRAEQSEAKYASEKLRGALRAAAQRAEAIDPDDVVELLLTKGARIDGDRVVFGQGAEAKPADEYVSAFVESKPHYKRSAAVAQGSGSPTTPAQSAPTLPPKPRPAPGDAQAQQAAFRDTVKTAAKSKAKPAA